MKIEVYIPESVIDEMIRATGFASVRSIRWVLVCRTEEVV